jgi:hypothetical protein
VGLEPTFPGPQPGASSGLASATEECPGIEPGGAPCPSAASNRLAHLATRIPWRKAEESNPRPLRRPGFQDRLPPTRRYLPSLPPPHRAPFRHSVRQGDSPDPQYPRQDSNLHPDQREPGLNRLRIPVPPRGRRSQGRESNPRTTGYEPVEVAVPPPCSTSSQDRSMRLHRQPVPVGRAGSGAGGTRTRDLSITSR